MDLMDQKEPLWLITGIEGSLLGLNACIKMASSPELVSWQGHKEDWLDLLHGLPVTLETGLTELAPSRTFFLQALETAPEVVIMGAGHVSLPLAAYCKLLDFKVTILDDRAQFANRERFPEADQVLCDSFEALLPQVTDRGQAYYVIVTRGHQYDRFCLEEVLKGDFAYVGMIGSRSKVASVMTYMKAEGFSDELLSQVHSPIGLAIGAKTPAEVALSIAAQIIEVKNKRNQEALWTPEIIASLKKSDQPAALITIIDKTGSSPRGSGTKMLVFADGQTLGTVGGGAAEHLAALEGVKVIQRNEPMLFDYDMTAKDARHAGMICGGYIRMLIQPLIY